MEIPFERLPKETLRALLMDYVTRDGTADVPREEKVEQVEAQLREGKVVITYDAESETFDIQVKPRK